MFRAPTKEVAGWPTLGIVHSPPVPHLTLVDADAHVAEALSKAFADVSQVRVLHCDIVTVARGAVVSPANGYGYMDGGVDARYSAFFGPSLELRVQDAIARAGGPPLPIGTSLVVETRHAAIPWLVVVPTMILPETVDATHAYRAARALFRRMASEPNRLREVFCPAMATGVGGVAPDDAAEAMRRALGDALAAGFSLDAA